MEVLNLGRIRIGKGGIAGRAVKNLFRKLKKPCANHRHHVYDYSPPDSGCLSEYATCSNNGLYSSGVNGNGVASSYTNLPLTFQSATNETRASAVSESVSRNLSKQGSKPLFSYRSDSALRQTRSTSVDSPHRPSLKGSRCTGQSAANLRSYSSTQKLRHGSSHKNPEIEINGHSYCVLGSLGAGGSSKVYQVLDYADSKLCALKCVDLSRTDAVQRGAYLNEIKLLKRLSNTGCVVKLYDYELRRHYLYILMEKGDIDLASFLRTRRTEIDDLFIRYYWNEMLKCVGVIHKEGIVHLDLKPANFLFVKGALKLIDFGIASALPSNKTSVLKETQMGTLSYMAPEVIKGDNSSGDDSGARPCFKINRKADVWSLGCILYNMVYGCTPFQKYRAVFEKVNAIMNQPVVFKDIEDRDLLDVMKRCLERDPNKRASVDELLNHRYVKGKKSVFDQSVMLKDDDNFLKIAEDLRKNSPRSFAKKLRDLMVK
ncbi:unnamed protein product [Enterobius vermicularis]|uniref:Protein kinase domain-containing protein n=1 Tax=Enterobius vermicularis TaxID=51028 RepID=A0A0N4UUW4_ENTVE|nr:unnamed protein product [Enterobius vermicularis]